MNQFAVVVRPVLHPAASEDVQRVVFTEPQQALEHLQRTAYGYTQYGAYSLRPVELAPVPGVLARISLRPTVATGGPSLLVEARSDLLWRKDSQDVAGPDITHQEPEWVRRSRLGSQCTKDLTNA